MAKRNTHKEQQALLGELESIKTLLDDNEFDAIPLLEEMVPDDGSIATPENAVAAEPPEPLATSATSQAEPLAPGALPGQQSLFTDKSVTKSPAKPAVSSENPFLPQHIRERLKGNDPGIEMPELSGKPIVMAPTPSPLNYEQQQLVDTLIAEFIPKIEAELRRRLEDKLK